jgi:hypothetical protein
MVISAYLSASHRHNSLLAQEDLFLSLFLSFHPCHHETRPKKPAKAGYRIDDYGMDYIGAVEDPMDTVIGAALLATGQEYARRTGKNMKTDRISVTDAGAGMRVVFAPTDALIDKNVVAISLGLEGDEEISSFKMPDLKPTKTDPVCEKKNHRSASTASKLPAF